MALISKINWRSEVPNSAGYYSYLCNGEFSGRCSSKQHFEVGQTVGVGIEVRYVKDKQTEYTNFKILGLAFEDEHK